MKYNTNCLVCTAPIGPMYLDLTDQPLANSYHKGEELETYPLQLNICTNCWHSQLSVSVEPAKMFKHYLYVSDTSKTLTDYFRWTKNYILDKIQPNQVLEIACNSGLFLDMFQKDGFKCVGVDPAENLRELSKARNLEVYPTYWNQYTSNVVKEAHSEFDLVLAFHVLPHVPDPGEFINACKSILSPVGQLFIQTSQCDMIANNEFDVVYHEHSSYFTANSIRELAHRNGLYVSSIIKTDIHSKSYLFSLQKTKCNELQLNDLISSETFLGLYQKETYFDFAQKALQTKEILKAKLTEFKEAGYTLIGYGAAAKGNTLLNYSKIKLDYIIDDNPMKENYLTPGMDIPICSIELLEQNFPKICFIPLAWNFYDEIKERIQKVRATRNDVFIKYFPTYQEEVTYVKSRN